MIAIYARQSVEKKDSISIDGQIDLCQRECSGETPKIFSDKGYSGKNTDRPSFQRMMVAVERGEVSKIIVYRLDRVSRSITDFGRIWEFLKQHNADFVSVNEKFDTSTPVGRAMVYIIMVFAQLERETIAERVKDNYYQRAKRGTWVGGPAAFGFTLKRVIFEGKKASMLVPNENINIVKEIFRLYAYSNYSLSKIAAWLTESGIQGIRRKTWDNVSIARILHNPSYVKADADIYHYFKSKGLIIYNDIFEFTGEKGLLLCGKRDSAKSKYTNLDNQLLTIAAHDGIISSGTFLECQRRLDENRQIKNTGSGKYTWLSGLAKCGNCGYSLRVINSGEGRYLYFNCSGRSNLHICNVSHHEHIQDVEAEASRQIQDEIDRLTHEVKPAETHETHNTEKIELAKLDEQIGKLMDKLEESSDVTMRYINERILKLDSRRKELLNVINSAPKHPAFRFSGCGFSALNFDEKKAVAQALVDRVNILNDEVTVYFK